MDIIWVKLYQSSSTDVSYFWADRHVSIDAAAIALAAMVIKGAGLLINRIQLEYIPCSKTFTGTSLKNFVVELMSSDTLFQSLMI